MLTTHNGQKHFSKSVILAIGGGIINPIKLDVEDSDKYVNTNLNYSIKELKKFKDKVVLISGGGYTAVDWANEFHPIAKKVFLTYRKGKDQMQAHEADLSRLFQSPVEFYFYTEITKFIPDESGQVIKQVELTNNQTGEVTRLSVNEVVVNHGYHRDSSLFENSDLKLEMANEYYLKGTAHCETNIPGLYAVGDAVEYEGKVHLILGAFQDAVKAVNKAKKFVQPDAEETALVSSHNEVFLSRNREIIDKQILGSIK